MISSTSEVTIAVNAAPMDAYRHFKSIAFEREFFEFIDKIFHIDLQLSSNTI